MNRQILRFVTVTTAPGDEDVHIVATTPGGSTRVVILSREDALLVISAAATTMRRAEAKRNALAEIRSEATS